MHDEKGQYMAWVRIGIVAGLIASILYPLMIFLSLPKSLTVIFACLFGPLLGVASIGLYFFLRARRKTISGQLAALSNIIAGVLFNLMTIVQLSVNLSIDDLMASAEGGIAESTMKWVWRVVDRVQLGMDISWDFFIGAGTILFGIAMLKHPRFGRIFGGAGILVGLLLLGFNFATFPVPPDSAGLVDLGPVLGLWYLVATVQVIISLKWLDRQLSSRPEPPSSAI
jgi:hypothetical protein